MIKPVKQRVLDLARELGVLRPRDLAGIPREYRAGIIEQWGTGTLKVIDWCRDNANPAPVWTEDSGSVVVTFRPAPGFTREVTAQVTAQINEEVTRLLPLCQTSQSRDDLMHQLGLGHREHFRKAYLLPALEAGLLERTIPDKPQSSKQRYRLTADGKQWLKTRSAGEKTA